jgi:hypothetical protein
LKDKPIFFHLLILNAMYFIFNTDVTGDNYFWVLFSLIGGVSAANVSVAIVRQSVSLVSVGCAISAIEGTLGIGSGQETDGGQGQFDFGTARHGNGTDGFVNTVPIHRHFNDGAL